MVHCSLVLVALGARMPALDPLRGVRARPGRICGLLSVCLAVGAVGSAACRRETLPAALEAPPTRPPTVGVATHEAVVIAVPPDPGAGLMQGRLVDAVSGLPVPEADVRLQSHGRRVLSGPDGRFRFDGVEAGPVSLRILPPDDHVPRALIRQAGPAGLDIGLVALVPAESAAVVVPEYGGVAGGCGPTQLAIATDVLREPVELRVTCVPAAGPLPAAPPADRLAVSVVHLSPVALALRRPALLTVALPIEPRFRAGTQLDLLRLDFDTLRWGPAGTVEVATGGSAAQGTVDRLGTFLVAAPPFGSADITAAAGPSVGGIHATDRAGGHLVERFDPGIPLVYIAFDYRGMDNTVIRVSTTDETGAVVQVAQRPYVGDGHDDVPLANGGGWPEGVYLSKVRLPGQAEAQLEWLVESLPTLSGTESGATGTGCLPPAGWYPHVIRSGDTLSGLATAQGLSVGELQTANCMAGETIFAGLTLYLPAPTVRAPPVRWVPPRPVPGPIPIPYPRTWPPPRARPIPAPVGPPGGSGGLPVPGPGDPTLAPRPTLPPLP